MISTKKFQYISISLFFISFFFPFISYGQHWNSVNLSISSAHGNNNCHNPDKTYNFSFSVNLPSDLETSTQAQRYTIAPVTNPPYTTSIRDLNGRHSISTTNNLSNLFQPFGTNNVGDFTIRYDEDWREETIVLELETTVEYTLVSKNTEYSADGAAVNTIERVLDRKQKIFRQTFTFELGDYLGQPAPILVNGVPISELNLDVLRDCGTYTLTSTLAEGADIHQWVLPQASWLVSSPASLNSASIQISPDFNHVSSGDINFNNIEFQAIQYCDGPRVKKSGLPTKITVPVIQTTKAQICAKDITQLTIPSFPSETSVYWAVNGQKIELLSGQSTHTAALKAKGNLKEYSTVNLLIQTNCGVFTVPKRFWLGTPVQPLTNPTGHPTVNIPYQSFQNFQITNHDKGQSSQGYTWSVTPNQLTVQLYNNTKSCRVWADQTGNYNYYVKRQNDCGWSDIGGGAIRIQSNTSGGGGGSGNPVGVIYRVNPNDPNGLSQTNMAQDLSLEKTNNQQNNSSTENTNRTNPLNDLSNNTPISLSVYPNPASNLIQLQLSNSNGNTIDLSTADIQVKDINGQQVVRDTGNLINVLTLTTGIYFIQVKSAMGIASTKLIIQ